MKPLITNHNLIQQLQERELVAQVTDEKGLIDRLAKGSISLYCGFDPTSDSLHLGHLVPLLCLKRFQLAGHKPVALIGGATGLIGDPSFKIGERQLNEKKVVNQWLKKISKQITLFLNFDCYDNCTIIVNNLDWFANMKVLNFLRDIGKHFSVNKMINKEAVKSRLHHDGSSISFTEFSYNLLQGYDFAYLNNTLKVELQIGGSDQWGNITSGIDLTRRLYKKKVYGLTVPLITKADGTKFGKTESGTIWLNAKKTSPYKFYQFWINTADADVYRFLKFFTFMTLKEISALEDEDRNSNKAPKAQKILAEQVTGLIHRKEGLAAAQRITHSLFSGSLCKMTEQDFIQLAQDSMPTIKLTYNTDLQQVLVDAKLAPSRNKARTLINSGAITLNGVKQFNESYYFSQTDRLFGRYSLLRRGKKHYHLLIWK